MRSAASSTGSPAVDVEGGAGSGLVGRFLAASSIASGRGRYVRGVVGDHQGRTFVTGEADLGRPCAGAWDAIVAVFSASPIGSSTAHRSDRRMGRATGVGCRHHLEGEGASVIGHSFIAGVVGRVGRGRLLHRPMGRDQGHLRHRRGDLGDLARADMGRHRGDVPGEPGRQLFEWIAPKLPRRGRLRS